jgi:hypothetical protein
LIRLLVSIVVSLGKQLHEGLVTRDRFEFVFVSNPQLRALAQLWCSFSLVQYERFKNKNYDAWCPPCADFLKSGEEQRREEEDKRRG